MKQSRSPLRILTKEVSSIVDLYHVTKWSYASFELTPQNHLRAKENPSGDLCLLDREGESVAQYKNKGHLKADLMRSRIKDLRHVLFVRLISALEVFFVDSIRYAFVRRPEILSSNKKKLEFTHGQIIATRDIAALRRNLISKETRSLHSAGFREVVKYYSSQLNISFANLGIDLNLLERSHDRRHLLVHRLGSTDATYRHKYNEKASSIRIDEPEILAVAKAIKEVGLKIDNALEVKVANTADGSKSRLSQCEIEFELMGSKFPRILQPNYCFIDRDRYVRNSEFFSVEKKSDKYYSIHAACERDDLAMIRKVLKKLERREEISVKSWNAISKMMKRKSDLPKQHLANIARLLPRRDHWHIGIHKDLAQVLGVSNSQASRIISAVLDDSSLLSELGTDVHESFCQASQQGDPADDLTVATDL